MRLGAFQRYAKHPEGLIELKITFGTFYRNVPALAKHLSEHLFSHFHNTKFLDSHPTRAYNR